MIDIDWEDVLYHCLAGLAIGLIGGLLSHWKVAFTLFDLLISFQVGVVIIWLNTFGWFIREYFQKPNKDRLYKHQQVILEYVTPVVLGWIGFALGKIAIERFLL